MTLPPIDFAGLALALLDRVSSLLPQWLPNGIERSNRWYVGDFDGSPGESANVNMLTGQWIDNAAPDEECGGDLTSLYARIHGLNNGQAARQLMQDLGWERQPLVGVVQASVPTRRDGPPEPPPAAYEQHHAETDPPFDEPADAGAVSPKAARRKPRWQPIVPVPPHAPQPTFKFGFKNKRTNEWVDQEAVRTWRYEFDGVLYGHVARYERTNTDGALVKDTVPWAWCTDTYDDRGHQRWQGKAWDAPRPLYVPRGRLSADPALIPVVLVEGEKCAEAGHQLLGDEFDFVSWPGGCKTWALGNWAWLAGRMVYLWPDCDAKRARLTKAEQESDVDPASKPLLPEHKQPGMQAMVHVGTLLLADHGCNAAMVGIPKPNAVTDGWDIADAIAQGWDADQVRAYIRAASVFVPPSDEARAKLDMGISTPSLAGAGKGGGGGAGGAVDDDEDPNAAWRKHLLQTAKGATAAVRENIVLALDGWPDRGIKGIAEVAGVIGFNEFTNNVEKRREAPWGSPAGVWFEEDELLMGEWLLRQHWLPSVSRQTLIEAVSMVARRHAFHPVRERVIALRNRWDGTQRLRTWLERCCFDPKDPALKDPNLRKYLARAGTWFLMAMCARVMPEKRDRGFVVCGPGTKFDYMLILEGPQSAGKSTLASVLGGLYFADTGLDIGQKDSYQNIQGIWVYEWGELENLTKQEVGKVKLFVSSPKDRFRASFDKRPRDYPRQCVFFGSTNEAQYLTDITGNRRFWPVRISRPPDRDWLQDNLEQLLAEAVHYVDAGERFYPTREEQRMLFDPQQRERTVESSIEGAIRAYLYDEDQKVPMGAANGALISQVSLVDLLTRIGYTIDRQTDAVVKKAGAVMHMLGWPVKRSSSPGRPRLYTRPAQLPEEASAFAVDSFLPQPQPPATGHSTEGDDSDIPF